MPDTELHRRAEAAKEAFITLSALDAQVRNDALEAVARALLRDADAIIAANALDLADAQESGLAAPLLARLRFDRHKLEASAAGVRAIAALPDPIGQTQLAREIASGLNLYRVSCPIGVVGVVFESRPDALVQISSLCLKSGNAALLKGGREAARTNEALYSAILSGTSAVGLPVDWLHLLHSREEVASILSMDDCVDLIIPRGSNAFVRYIQEHTRIPVLGHAEGVCHVYVDNPCDVAMAVRVTVDSKTQYPAVCNAAETLLVHAGIADAFLPRAAEALRAKGVRLLGCERTRAIIACEPATEADWRAEYLDLTLSVRVVDGVRDAIAHINRYGSRHTDAIVTDSTEHAKLFLTRVDSADVFLNCSTRFSDGFRFGLGAEVGIATGKLHARGPMGLEGLCTYKYLMLGSGQTVSDLEGGGASYTHIDINKRFPL